ncbi:MAG: hypothetical protein WAN86_19570 [Hyphomicrobiaceae bacterium]
MPVPAHGPMPSSTHQPGAQQLPDGMCNVLGADGSGIGHGFVAPAILRLRDFATLSHVCRAMAKCGLLCGRVASMADGRTVLR